MAIKVVGLGMGRTGTYSLKLALEKLGFGPCYHMETLLEHPEEVKYWKELDRTGRTDWQALWGDYQSAVDFPTIAYYQAVLQQYPEAQCILTLREEEKWYESAINTILDAEPGLREKVIMSFRMPFSVRLRHLVQVFQLTNKFWTRQAGPKFKQKQNALTFYRRWNEQMIHEIPEERLLVYQISEGWEPLCTFLSVAVPNEPFPHANIRSEFKDKNKKLLA